jgi:HAE1 family hydrophobic/amphiphilic exporter-1
MNVIRFSIDYPVTIIVGVLFLLLFGIVSLQQIPVQLSPSVQEPVITVTTVWPGATPYEIERDIIEEQEDVLKGIPGLYEMESTSSNNRGTVTLRFEIGTDIDNALLRTSNKLDEVPSYPETVDRPVINASGAESSPVMWIMLQTLEGNEESVYNYLTYFENNVRQFLDRVDGVADLFIGGGANTEMHVRVIPEKLASYGLTVDAVITALQSGNANVSAGNLAVGRRDFRVRTVAEYRTPGEILDVVVVADGEREVRVGDVAEASLGYQKLDTPVFSRFQPGISIGIRPEPNTNILELTDRVEVAVNELNESLLPAAGLQLTIVNEQRPYIRGAIDLLKQNIAIGGALAIGVLLLFLRSLAPTLVVSTAIPLSIIGTFIAMLSLGSTLNVVSLAGIAFAVGMLVDNAIVVLENIERHRSMGKPPAEAAYKGAQEVWGAVLASSLTTVAVFLPVIFLEDEAGQLFKDIAIAVSCAVSLSLIISMTVIPMLSKQLFTFTERRQTRAGRAAHKRIGHIGDALSKVFMGVVRGLLFNAFTRLAAIIVIAGGALLTAWLLVPKMEYLPQGNRDLIINVLIPPPGLSYEERYAIGERIFERFRPYHDAEKDGYPRVRHMFYVGRQATMILGVVSEDQARARELIPLCQEILGEIPGVFSITNQASIFQRGLGEGRTVSVDLSGPSIDQLVAAGGALMGAIREGIEEVQVRPVPSLDLAYPEANFVPDRERLRAVGMTARQFGIALDVLMDGRDIGDYKREGEKKIELILKVADSDIETPEALYDALLVTPAGQTVQVSSLAKLERTTGLTEIRHLERDRTVTLQVTPPYSVTLQEAMERIEHEMVPRLREQGVLDDIQIGMSGAADKLTVTREALQWNFVLAAMISYLLMSALLGNFIYPFIIMFTVPLAGAGGLIGLALVNRFVAPQQLDILTMLGFIILIGIVVNNAILIVYRALQNVREEGLDYKEAVFESVQTRLRPIYMSACTSVFGMLPLVLWPGPGSELYRGLGSVVLGGLALSTVFTVFLIPALLIFFIRWEKKPEANEASPG